MLFFLIFWRHSTNCPILDWLLKLNHYGIRNSNLIWTTDFLSGRSQDVLLDGHLSTESPVSSGVPPGTVLGPLLFLVYINDLPNRVRSTLWMFADYCLVYHEIRDIHDTRTLQDDLDSLQRWEQDWLIEFNLSKCEAVSFTKKTNQCQGRL